MTFDDLIAPVSRMRDRFATGARFIGRILQHQPLTVRGACVLLAAFLSYASLGQQEDDLVIQLLSGAFVFLVIVAILLVTIGRLVIQKHLYASTTFDRSHCVAGKPIAAGIILEQCNILPFCRLEIRRCFSAPPLISPEHIVTGMHRHQLTRRLTDTVIFPHRGQWHLQHLLFCISDGMGFGRVRWKFPVDTYVDVLPRQPFIKPLPIVATSSQSGDIHAQVFERSGDLFDIKTYDPSDGIRRIMWKTLAKSGQVVVRRPEPAVVPEGEIALYLIASKEDDRVAGALLRYYEMLRSNNIAVVFGTDVLSQLIIDKDEIPLAAIADVWNVASGSGNGLARFFEQLAVQFQHISQAVIFISEENPSLEHQALSIPSLSQSVTFVTVPQIHILATSTQRKPWSQWFRTLRPNEIKAPVYQLATGISRLSCEVLEGSHNCSSEDPYWENSL